MLLLQRQAYNKSLRLVHDSLQPTLALNRYARKYQQSVRHFQSIATKNDLLDQIATTNIVYHGDYHTLKQSQRSVLRVLREIVYRREIVLCLEMFMAHHQNHIDAWMNGKISEHQFLKRIEYSRTWGFPWENYKPILEFCKEHMIQVAGINSPQEPASRNPLSVRDDNAAKVISLLVIRNPGNLIYVVDGDYHVAPVHLPRAVDRLLNQLDVSVRKTILYQNVETLYWQLAAQHKEETDILRISDDSFCIINATPLNKLQSFLNWLEYTDDAYYPSHGVWSDATDTPVVNSVPDLVITMCSLLKIELPSDALERLTIYYASDLNFMDLLREHPHPASFMVRIRAKIANNEGFLLSLENTTPATHIIYLPNSSINMAAEEASHFVNEILRGPLAVRLSNFDLFYRSVVTECLGFFGSKLINEKRKVQAPSALRSFIRGCKGKKISHDEHKRLYIARCILGHYSLGGRTAGPDTYKKKFHTIYHPGKPVFWIVSTQIGYILGDRLFQCVKRGKISVREARDLFFQPLGAPTEAFKSYRSLMERIHAVG